MTVVRGNQMPAGNTPLRVAVLLCEHVEGLGNAVNLAAIQRWFAELDPTVVFQVVPQLCTTPAGLPELLTALAVDRVVFGLCREQRRPEHIATQVREAGLDPLGLETVNLGLMTSTRTDPETATRAGCLLLAGAVAKVRTYPGSSVDNVKPRLPTRLSRRSFLGLPLLTYEVVPSILRSRCVAERGCTLCAQACPYGALKAQDGEILLEKTRCQSCAFCVTACPREAVYFPGSTSAQIEAQVRALLASDTDHAQSHGILYVCGHNATARASVHPGWLPVQLPCVAMVPPTWYLAPLLLGAHAVGVWPCNEQCSQTLTQTIAERVHFAQHFLEAVGLPSDLIQYRPTVTSPPAVGQSSFQITKIQRELSDPVFSLQPKAIASLLSKFAQRGLWDFTASSQSPPATFAHHAAPLGIVQIDETVCTACGLCADICPTEALRAETAADYWTLRFEAMSCIACAQCVSVCPEQTRGAIRVHRVISWEQLLAGPQVVAQDRWTRCVRCGASIAPARMLDRVMALLTNESATLHENLTAYCVSCRLIAGHSAGGSDHDTRGTARSIGSQS